MRGNLFSSYFLEEGIKNTEDWKRCSSEELRGIYYKAKGVFTEFIKRKEPDEADTEDGLISPLIELLGFQWSRQKSPSTKGRQDVPDFVLFPDERAKEEFDQSPRNNKPWDKAICILEAKRWQRHLDRRDKTDPLDPRIPSNQILRYLSMAEPASNGRILWGILTNGELWRLYYQKASSRAEGYVEFNLSEIFKGPNLSENELQKIEEFKLFYLLLRKEAFIPTEWRPHKSFLEIALDEGRRWEEKVAEDLKEKIFDEVFPDIARGFLENAKREGRGIDSKLLKEIYDNTLVLLYRLLFILYAEDRDLLPVRSEGYKNYSLSQIRDEIARKIDRNETLSETGAFYWSRIKNLFRIINNGDKSLNVPLYNGGLFDPKKHPFLENHSVSDKFLVPALDKLSRDYKQNPPKRINYRDLSVRQLGSIYEGLLEFKLEIAKTDLGIKKEKGKEIYYPVENPEKVKIKKGELYLTNDKSERKSTGSYYTPDYIVQYIVKNTIEPLIQEKLYEFKKEIKDLKALKGKTKEWKNIELKKHDPAEAILKLKILDPAMGSGHFLVGAVDYLSDKILEVLAETSDKCYFGKEMTYRSPLLDKLESVRQKILEKGRKEGYVIDETKLEDKNLIRRIILKRCIYGVDLNPLAVELAKVSLWLHTFTIGAPLSFLNHHLKCGNSLIGAAPEDFDASLKSNLFGSRYEGIKAAVGMVKRIQELSDAEISEVEESAKIYEDVVKHLEPYKKLLDVYTADFFLKPKKRSELKNYISPLTLLDGTMGDPLGIITGKIELPEDKKLLIDRALELAEGKRFFHWKLEFPEVWYEKGKEKANGGFDVVIGNPPYIKIQEMRKSHPLEVNFYTKFFITPVGSYDIFVLFVEKGLSLLNKNGILGYILPNKFTKLDYGKKLRGLISKHLLKFIDFGDNQVFPGQTTYTSLLFLSGSERDKAFVTKTPSLTEKLEHWLLKSDGYMYEVETDGITDSPWILLPQNKMQILQKIEKNSISLKEFVEKIIVGIQTSADEIYILEKLSLEGDSYKVYSKASGREFLLEKELLKPLVSGEHIERYYARRSSKLLLFPYKLLPDGGAELIPQIEFEKKYPKIWRYLKEHEEKLRNREGGKFNDNNWYRLGRTQNLDKHERPKFGVPRLCERLRIFFDKNGDFYFDNVDVNGILLKNDGEYSPYYLLAILNSKVIDWRFKAGSVPFRGNFFSANKQFLSPLPIPQIDFNTRDKGILKNLRENYLKSLPLRELITRIKSLPPNSAVLHDFLSYLAQKMTELSQNKYLLQLFVDGKLEHGTDEMIQVLKLLEKHPEWRSGISEDLKKEIARNIIRDYENIITQTDNLIDQIVYHMYELNYDNIKIIEGY